MTRSVQPQVSIPQYGLEESQTLTVGMHSPWLDPRVWMRVGAGVTARRIGRPSYRRSSFSNPLPAEARFGRWTRFELRFVLHNPLMCWEFAMPWQGQSVPPEFLSAQHAPPPQRAIWSLCGEQREPRFAWPLSKGLLGPVVSKSRTDGHRSAVSNCLHARSKHPACRYWKSLRMLRGKIFTKDELFTSAPRLKARVDLGD